MDEYVQFKDGQFVMSSCTPKAVGLSSRVFNHMEELMQAQNDYVKTLKVGSYDVTPQNTLIMTDNGINTIRLKTRSEPGGGSMANGVEIEYGAHGGTVNIYITYFTLSRSGNMLTAAGIAIGTGGSVTGNIPAVAIGGACGLSGVYCSDMALSNPNGVKLTIPLPPPPAVQSSACFPFHIFSR